MTSPRQRKKRLAFLKLQEKLAENIPTDHKPVIQEKQVQEQKSEPAKPVAAAPQSVVESEVAAKPKKSKTVSMEVKQPEAVLEQAKQEVKTEIKE